MCAPATPGRQENKPPDSGASASVEAGRRGRALGMNSVERSGPPNAMLEGRGTGMSIT